MKTRKKGEVKVEKIYPLTPLQLGILSYTRLYGDSMYIVQKQISIKGILDKKALEQTLIYLSQRYEVLRTFFVVSKMKEPVQVVLKERKFKLDYEEIIDKTEEEQEMIIKEYLEETRKKGFDVLKDMLIKLKVVRTQNNQYELLWTIHHLILDGWSTGILLNDFIQIYTDIIKGFPINTIKRNRFDSYVKLIITKAQKGLNQWKKYLEGYDTVVTCIGKNISDNIYENKPVEKSFYLDEGLTKGLGSIVASEKITLNTLIETIWGVVLQKYNTTDDVVYGYISSGRNVDIEGIYEIVGLLINTIPIRIQTKMDETFRELLNKVNKESIDMQKYEFTSLVDIQESTIVKRNLINNILVFENYPFDGDLNSDEVKNKRGFEVLNITGKEETNYALTVVITPGKKLNIEFMYNSEVFTETEMDKLQSSLVFVIEQITKNPDIQCKDISICCENEKNQILEWSCNSEYLYNKDICIHEIFTLQAKRTPDNIAVVLDEKSITYKELDKKSNQLANKLRIQGVKPDNLVGISIEKSIELIIGILGILKSGAAYVPIDVDYPLERIKNMLVQAEAKIVLVGNQILGLQLPIEQINLYDEVNYIEIDKDLISVNSQNDLAYAIFTSGTTGVAKGVLIQHYNVVRLLFNEGFQFDFNEMDVWTMFSSSSFDFSVWEMYGALLRGGKLVLVTKEQARNSKEFMNILYKQEVTVLNQVPSALYNLIDNFERTLPKLRYLITGGEALNPEKLKKFKEQNTHTKIVNMYGITETTVHTTYKEITGMDMDSKVSNIGRPLPTLDVYIMNDESFCGVGVVGEIYVAGEGVARGYLNNKLLTDSKFVNIKSLNGKRVYKSGDLGRWLPNGEIEYIGRRDEQVKIRGFRIELKEIEQVIMKQPNVKNSVALVRKNQLGDKEICAYFIGKNVEIDDIKNIISNRLPDYMMPGKLIKMDSFVLTKNGKVDKKVLEDMSISSEKDYLPPTDEIEERVIKLFEEILHVKKVSIDDNFFEIGGHSLNVTVLESKIKDTFLVHVPLVDIFKFPTVKEISEFIKQKKDEPAIICKMIPVAAKKDVYDLSYMQQSIWSTVKMNEEDSTLNIVLSIIFENIDLDIFEKSMKALIEKHHSLRTRFSVIEGVPKQKIVSYNEGLYECEKVDISNSSNLEEVMDELISEQVNTPFIIEDNSLIRMKLVKISKDKQLFIFTIHHILTDAWSMDILCKDMLDIYDDFNNCKEPKVELPLIQYVDFVEWQKEYLSGKERVKLQNYWKEVLKPKLPVLNIKTDYKRSDVDSIAGDSIELIFEEELLVKLKEQAIQYQGTLFMSLLTSIYTLFYRYSGQDDIIIGTPVAGRQHGQVYNLVGYFLNILPLRLNLKGTENFEELFGMVKEVALGAYAHQDYPFGLMLEDTVLPRESGHSSVFDVMVQLINTKYSKIMEFGDSKMKVYEKKSNQSKYDLVFNFLESDDCFTLCLEYKTSLFKKKTVERILKRLKIIIEKMLDKPTQSIGEFKLDEKVEISKIVPVRKRGF